MNQIVELIDNTDGCSLLIVALIVGFVGHKMAVRFPELSPWGPRIAVAAGIAYAVYGLQQDEPFTGERLLGITMRSLLAGGLALGPTWVVLAVSGFARVQLIDPFRRQLELLAEADKKRRVEANEKHQQQQRQEEWKKSQEKAQRDYEAAAPERERAEKEAAEKAKQEAEHQHRREQARLQCELVYAAHEEDLGKQLKREHFQGYMDRYLNDKYPVEVVEKRAQHLLDQLQQALQKIDPTPQYHSLKEIDAWYREQLLTVEPMPEGRLKELLLAQIHKRHEELITEFMQGVGQ